MQGMHNGQNPAQAVPRNNLGVLRGHSVSIAGCGFARGRPLALPMRPGREAERLTEDPFGGVDGKRGADQGLDDFGDRAAATDRDLLDALIEIGIDLQLQALGEPHGIDRDGLPFRGGGRARGQYKRTNSWQSFCAIQRNSATFMGGGYPEEPALSYEDMRATTGSCR